MINIEKPPQLTSFLAQNGLISPEEGFQFEILKGGVSNRAVLIKRHKGDSWVFKQALPKLRVETDWFCPTNRIHQEAQALSWLMKLIPDNVPALIFEDEKNHILGMTAVPFPHINWKTELLNGNVDLDHIASFAQLLAKIHNAIIYYPELKSDLQDYSFFESLRLEPYYAFTASQLPESTSYMNELITETKSRKLALVHGDYSPKNVLIHQHQMVILDYEVMHIGDPAFDLGFSLTHFLSKGHFLPSFRTQIFKAALLYWETYQKARSNPIGDVDFERFAVKHTLACMLARVYGRSPLEYLGQSQRDLQKSVILEMLASPPNTIQEMVFRFQKSINDIPNPHQN